MTANMERRRLRRDHDAGRRACAFCGAQAALSRDTSLWLIAPRQNCWRSHLRLVGRGAVRPSVPGRLCPAACARPSVPGGLCPAVCARPSVPGSLCPAVCARPSVPGSLCPAVCASQVQNVGSGRNAGFGCHFHRTRHGLFIMMQNRRQDIDHPLAGGRCLHCRQARGLHRACAASDRAACGRRRASRQTGPRCAAPRACAGSRHCPPLSAAVRRCQPLSAVVRHWFDALPIAAPSVRARRAGSGPVGDGAAPDSDADHG